MSRERVVRIWGQVRQQSRDAPISVAHVCAAVAAGVAMDGAGVTVMAGPMVRDTVHATDPVAGELEEWQLTLGQGPCQDAFTVGGPVLVVDLRSPGYSARWPAFTPVALESGARALFALPVQVGAIRLGVLSLYRTRPGRLSPDELADTLAFADAAGVLLLAGAAADTPPDAAELAWQRDDPTAHHAQVHQATGMLLVQLGVSAETAFARLRAYAYAENQRLGDVARAVVERRLRIPPDPPSADRDGTSNGDRDEE